MLYRFAAADTAAQVDARPRRGGRRAAGRRADRRRSPGSPPGRTAPAHTALFVPFLIAFGVLGLVMSVLIIGNVIAGAVSAGTRRIGILKALGFTPGQVVRAYLGQALIPAAVGAALGVVAGNLLPSRCWRRPTSSTARPTRGVAPWVDAAVLAGVLALVGADRLGRRVAGRPAAHGRRARRRPHPAARPRPVGGPADRPAPAAPAGHPRPGPPLRPAGPRRRRSSPRSRSAPPP